MKTNYLYSVWVLAACSLALLALFIASPFHVAASSFSNPAPTLTAIHPIEAYNHSETTITITGTGFFSITGGNPVIPQVSLGDVPLPNVSFADNTTLTATVPPGFPSGIYTLTVQNPDGQITNFPNAFAVLQASNGNLTAWKTASPMTKNRLSLAAVAVNGYVYALGGQSPSTDNSVERAPINADGSLGTWQAMNSMLTPRSYLAAAATNGFLYAIGGCCGNDGPFQTSALASVERAAINPDGSLGTWQAVSAMTTPRQALAAVVTGGYLYAIGGASRHFSPFDSVERAAINVDGSLGPWQVVSSMATTRCCLGAVALGRHIYAVGGQGGGSASLRTVERADIGSDGSLGAWESVTPMATARCDAAAVTVDGYIYAIGGGSCSGGAVHKSVERAEVNFDGSISSWETMPELATARYWLAAAQDKHNIYALGGQDETGTILDSVERAAVGFPELNHFSPFGVRSDQPTTVTVSGANMLPTPTLRLGDSISLTSILVFTTSLTTTIPSGLTNGWYTATLVNGDGRVVALPNAVRVDGPGPVVAGDLGLSINDGALFTNKITVTLAIGSRNDTAQMQVSNDGGFAGVQWETYTSHKTWQITLYGNYVIPRVVYVRYKDLTGSMSATFQDDIVLDVTAPTGSVNIADSKRVTPLEAMITVNLSATDDLSGVGDMVLSNTPDFVGASWQAYGISIPWALGSNNTVYVQFRDNAGNVSQTYSASLPWKLSLPLIVR